MRRRPEPRAAGADNHCYSPSKCTVSDDSQLLDRQHQPPPRDAMLTGNSFTSAGTRIRWAGSAVAGLPMLRSVQGRLNSLSRMAAIAETRCCASNEPMDGSEPSADANTPLAGTKPSGSGEIV